MFFLVSAGCSYADEVLTAEQAVLSAYWRARSISDAKLPLGAMAALGLTWDETVRRCPADVFPACHNWTDSVTVSKGRFSALSLFNDRAENALDADGGGSCLSSLVGGLCPAEGVFPQL